MLNKIISATFMVLILSSCNKYLDVNEDPDNPSEVPFENALPAAELELAANIGGSYGVIGGLWSQHYTQNNGSSQYANEDAYSLTNGDYNRSWIGLYAGLKNLDNIKKQAVAASNWNVNLIAVCLQAYGFQILSDFYDKIPYTQALNSAEFSNPVFDNGQVVYDGLITSLKDALSKDFTLKSNTQPSTDFIFAGNNTDWVKFAHTMLLKLTLRQTKVDAGINAKLQQILTDYDGDFLSSDAAITQFTDNPGKRNPLYETDKKSLNTDNNLNASYTLISFLQENNDNRIGLLFDTNADGDYFGGYQGNVNIPVSQESRSISILHPTTPFYFFSLDEVNFMIAEASERTGQDGQTYYEDGVTAAFAKLGIEADADAYLFGEGAVYAYPSAGTFNDKLKAIITQKWISHVGQGWESFFDQNRTGIPAISTVLPDDPSYVPGEYVYSYTGVTGTLFPKRILFPLVEVQNNNSTPTQIPLTTPVWWAN